MKICLYLMSFISLYSCSSPAVKKMMDEDVPFYSVDLSTIEDEKGEELLFSDLVESFEIIKLDNKDVALVNAFPNGTIVTDHYILVQPNALEAFKLYTREGQFLTNIGGIGQGPGEYKAVYEHQVDEKGKRIYLGPGNFDKLLVYDLEGTYLPDEVIRLPERTPICEIWLDADSRDLVVVTLPFSTNGNPKFPISKYLCWKQDRIGNMLQNIPAGHYSLSGDFSHGLFAPQNVNSVSFSIHENQSFLMRTRPDTLYHYDVAENRIKPCFTLDNVIQESKRFSTILYETSKYYWADVTVCPKELYMTGAPTRLNVFTVRVSKADGSVKRIDRFTNDYLGISYPTIAMVNGYVCVSYEPLKLMEVLDGILAKNDLKPEVRKNATDLRNSIQENDNDILMIGKLKP